MARYRGPSRSRALHRHDDIVPISPDCRKSFIRLSSSPLLPLSDPLPHFPRASATGTKAGCTRGSRPSVISTSTCRDVPSIAAPAESFSMTWRCWAPARTRTASAGPWPSPRTSHRPSCPATYRVRYPCMLPPLRAANPAMPCRGLGQKETTGPFPTTPPLTNSDCYECHVGAFSVVARRRHQAFTQHQRDWMLLRRGRYLEFNCTCDPADTRMTRHRPL